MLRYLPIPKRRILALDPVSQGFGFAVLEGDPQRLVDYGVAYCRRTPEGCDEAVRQRIELTQPSTVVVPSILEGSRLRVRALERFYEVIGHVLAREGLDVRPLRPSLVRSAFADRGADTRRAVHELLVTCFPELRARLPKPRLFFDPESPRTAIFDALAMAVTELEFGEDAHEIAA